MAWTTMKTTVVVCAVSFVVGAGTIAALIWTREAIPKSEWHNEPVLSENTTFTGSYKNAREDLVVESHQWKILAPTKKGGYEWGAKVVIRNKYPWTPDKDATGWAATAKPIMPITVLEYYLHDADGFLLAKMEIKDEPTRKGLGVIAGETETFQGVANISADYAVRAAHGRLNVVAGFNIDKQTQAYTPAKSLSP